MRKLILLLIILCPTSAWSTTYFLNTAGGGGNDANNGLTSGAPWLSPNHAVNCGDVILAAASTAYSATNFANNKWGTVTCAGANNVAWVKCVTFDACKITGAGVYGMWVNKSYWGVQGFEITLSGSFAACFLADPGPVAAVIVHHIIFANDICNGATDGGFQMVDNGAFGVDYFAVIGTISYNTTSDNSQCYSAINILTPQNFDVAVGTHIYVAGNFAWANIDPNPCAGGTPTDGEGAILDTLTHFSYSGQIVTYNNMFLANGGRGWQVILNNGTPHATLYAEYNTLWGNCTDTHQANGTPASEMLMNVSLSTTWLRNLAMTNKAQGCGTNNDYAFWVQSGNGTDVADFNWGYSASGFNSNIVGSAGFSYGASNVFGTNPVFTAAAAPGAPSCGLATSVTNCMATVIANFVPTAATSTAYGYQPVSNTSINDPLFPQWLCNVNLPVGLVTPGCGVVPSGSGTGGVIIQ